LSGLFAVLLLAVLMGIGVPIAWSFAAVLAFLTFLYDVNLDTLMLQGFRAINSVILVALPLFILAGHLMQSGGIARRLIDFVGRIATGRGGMGSSMVLASALFGAISGTATAAVASIGTIMADPLAKCGYPRGHTAALLGISSLLGILIPPSITLILFAVVTRQSVAACFAATVGPALLLTAGLILYNRFAAGRSFDEIPVAREDRSTFAGVFVAALPALTIPVIILGGIYGGVFTPTEAAGVAVVATLAVGGLVYREFSLASLKESVVGAAESTGSIVLILLFSFMISRILASEGIPQDLTVAVQGIADSPLFALALVIAVLVVTGALMDDISVTVVVAPLFLPMVVANGIDPIHFAAIVSTSVVIGANSPPVAPILFMACRVCDAPVHDTMWPALKMMLFVATPVMLVTALWPDLSLFLPRVLELL